MNNIDKQYQDLLEHIIKFGVEKKDRTGTGTKSIFGWQIRHNMQDGFPVLTTKKMAWKTMVAELLWFLRGDTNIHFLLENNCHIWNGDAIKNYEKHNGEIDWGPFVSKEEVFVESMNNIEFAKKWGELGPIYGKQWRRWELPNYSVEHVEYGEDNDSYVDQIHKLIHDLKTNPDSRRLMVNVWNVGELDKMVLPPCHYGFQLYTRELNFYELRNQLRAKINYSTDTAVTIADLQSVCVENNLPTRAISLMWNQRSVDTFLGLPFNIASYGLLLEIIAKIVNMVPEELVGNLGDTHLYLNHIEQAQTQLIRTHYELPKLKIGYTDAFWEQFSVEQFTRLKVDTFTLENYECHPSIKAPLSN